MVGQVGERERDIVSVCVVITISKFSSFSSYIYRCVCAYVLGPPLEQGDPRHKAMCRNSENLQKIL